MHVPWGVAGAFLFLYSAWVGATAIALMIGYEGFNDWRKKDSSYHDILGIVHGFVFASFIIWGAGL